VSENVDPSVDPDRGSQADAHVDETSFSESTERVRNLTLSRAARVVWRLGPDRVLVQRIGDRTSDGQADLHGIGAMLWLATDQPRSLVEVVAELHAADHAIESSAVDAAVDVLVATGWLLLGETR